MDGGVGFDEPELSWSTQDIENKIGFSGGRYTDTNAFFTFLVWLILSTLFFLVFEFVFGDFGFLLALVWLISDRHGLGKSKEGYDIYNPGNSALRAALGFGMEAELANF